MIIRYCPNHYGPCPKLCLALVLEKVLCLDMCTALGSHDQGFPLRNIPLDIKTLGSAHTIIHWELYTGNEPLNVTNKGLKLLRPKYGDLHAKKQTPNLNLTQTHAINNNE